MEVGEGGWWMDVTINREYPPDRPAVTLIVVPVGCEGRYIEGVPTVVTLRRRTATLHAHTKMTEFERDATPLPLRQITPRIN